MLAIQDIGDWINVIIVLVIVAGSALGGIVKAITAKLNRSREEVEAERDLQERQTSPRRMDRPAPPVARPMPPRRRPPPVMQRPVARPFNPPAPQSQTAPQPEVSTTLPPMVKTILETFLDVDIERQPPQPRPTSLQPPPRPRPAKSKVPKPAVGRRSIEEREERKAKLVEKRIGRVEPHVASAVSPPSPDDSGSMFERPTHADWRRAVVLNEILSPPLALRPPNERV